MAQTSIAKYLQPNERVVASADVRVDVRSYTTNAETPVPWADLARPRHNGTIALTADRLVIVFNPGTLRVVSLPVNNVLMCWERTAEGRGKAPNQVVFVLPAGMFCICEVEAPDAAPIDALRRISHALSRAGNLGSRGDVAIVGASDGVAEGMAGSISGII